MDLTTPSRALPRFRTNIGHCPVTVCARVSCYYVYARIQGWRFSLLLALLGVMSAATFVTILFSRIGLIGRESIGDPFLAYASIVPGQHWGGTLEHEFSCSASTMPSPVIVGNECVNHLHTGPLSQVDVTIWDGFIIRANFTLRENVLRIGDLVLLWGKPDIRLGQYAALTWDNRRAIAVAYLSPSRRFDYLLSVSHVILIPAEHMQPPE